MSFHINPVWHSLSSVSCSSMCFDLFISLAFFFFRNLTSQDAAEFPVETPTSFQDALFPWRWLPRYTIPGERMTTVGPFHARYSMKIAFYLAEFSLQVLGNGALMVSTCALQTDSKEQRILTECSSNGK